MKFKYFQTRKMQPDISIRKSIKKSNEFSLESENILIMDFYTWCPRRDSTDSRFWCNQIPLRKNIGWTYCLSIKFKGHISSFKKKLSKPIFNYESEK